jgi:threonine/homoserine/homoserine lactone efflux protein
MTYAENLWLYFALLVGIIIVPGMDMLFVVTSALTGGHRAGLAATAGMMLGGAAHTLFALAAVSVLLQAAPQLFVVMQIVGAAYMVWFGVALLRSTITLEAQAGEQRPGWSTFRQGTLTCLLNPKAYLFTAAVYPQFMTPAYGALWRQALVMGVLTVLTQGAIYGGLALAASQSRTWFGAGSPATILIGRAAGALLIAVAIWTAWHGWGALA